MHLKKIAAGGILATFYGLAATAIGRSIRGPYADGILRDFLTGAGTLGSAVAVSWAFGQFAEDKPDV